MNILRHNVTRLNLVLILLVVTVSVCSLFIGHLNEFSFALPTDAKLREIVIYEIRLPRLLLALLIGAALGLSGAVLQGLLRNPLAEPGIIGVSGGAALGAVIVMYFNIVGAGSILLPVGGIIGATISMTLLYFLAGKGGHLSKLIFAGIAINALTAALIALALNLAPSPYALSDILFWLMGSVSSRSMHHVLIMAPFVVVGTVLLSFSAKGLNALTLGEKGAASLGVNVAGLKFNVIVGAGIAVGASVSIAGSIGFVGLIVPHLLRRFVQFKPGALLWPSALAGSALLVIADIIIRVVPTNAELKLGVVTALFGAPFFIYLILSHKHVEY